MDAECWSLSSKLLLYASPSHCLLDPGRVFLYILRRSSVGGLGKRVKAVNDSCSGSDMVLANQCGWLVRLELRKEGLLPLSSQLRSFMC